MPEATPIEAPDVATPAAKRRFRRWLVALVIVLGVLWFLPTLVAKTFLLNWLVARATATVPGELRIGSASLGWFSPVVLRDVTWLDHNGKPLVEIPRLTSEHGLLRLLRNSSALGKFRAENPVVHLALDRTSSNVEDTLQKAAKPETTMPPTTPGGGGLAFSLECVEAKAHVRDLVADRAWELHPVHLQLDLNPAAAPSMQLQVQGVLAGATSPGQLRATFAMDTAKGEGECTGRLEGMPLALAEAVLRRWQALHKAKGQLQGDFKLAWKTKGETTTLATEGTLSAQDCDFAFDAAGKQRVRLASLTVPWKLAGDGGRLRVDKAEALCDGGRASFQGGLDLSRSTLVSLAEPGTTLTVDVDLARLAELAPALLSLQQDAKITAGKLNAEARSVAGARGVVWHGKVHTTDLRGVRGGKPVAWPEPVRLTFQTRPTNSQADLATWAALEHVRCESSFLQMDGQGTPEQFTLNANADLTKLAQALESFFDLGAMRLGGQANVQLTYKEEPDRRFKVGGTGDLKNIDIELNKGRPWKEQSLTVRVDVQGKRSPAGAYGIERGNAKLQSGSDLLDAQLLEGNGAWGRWDVRLQGELANWQARLRPWTSALDDWRLAGNATVQGQASITATHVDVSALSATAKPLQLQVPGLRLNEPTFDLQSSSGRVDWGKSVVLLKDAQVRCPAVNLNASNIEVAYAQQTKVTGAASLYGELGRLRQWFLDPAGPPPEFLAGGLMGTVQVQTTAERTVATCDLTVQDLIMGPPQNPRLREAKVKVAGQATIDWQQDAVQLQDLRVDSRLLTLEAKGRIAGLASRQEVDVTGKIHYDLEKFEPLLKPYLGAGAKIAGKDARPFNLAGTLRPAGPGKAAARDFTFTQLQGEAGLNWTSLHAYGFDVGPAEVRAQLQQGWLKVLPIEAAVNSGRLKLASNLRLEPAPAEVHVPAGLIVDKAQITRAMCASALGYAAPALANVTEVEGTVSLTLDTAVVPLGDPNQAEVQGKFMLHAAKVGPGPLVRELSTLMRTPAPASLVKESHVPFHLTKGRVHHRDLELIFPDFTVRTSGSVGLDGSLDLRAEMPIPPKWIGNNRLGTALAKRTIQLPIRGTVEHPRLDQQAMQAALAQFTRDAAADLLKQELENRLKNLFR